MKPNTAMVLAAGFGTRMGDLTRDCPKPLIPAAGRPLIEHVLNHAAAAGIARAVVNLHYRGDQLRAYLAGRQQPDILFSDEQPTIMDTGGGIVHALPLLGDKPFFGINSDAIFAGANPFQVLSDAWDPNRTDCLILLVPREKALAYTRPGDFFLDDAGLRRRGDAETAPLVYAGAQIVSPNVFAGMAAEPFSMNIVWNRLLAAGRMTAVVYPDPWVDVGTPEGLAEAARVLT